MAALALATTIWGSSFAAAQYLLQPVAGAIVVLLPLELATLRFTIVALFLLPWLAFHIPHLSKTDWLRFLLLGQLAISVYFYLQYTGLQLTNAAVAAVLVVGLIPLFSLLLDVLRHQVRLEPRVVAALLLGAVGVTVVSWQQAPGLAASTEFVVGVLCLIANAASFALYSVLARSLSNRVTPMQSTALIMIAGAAGLLLIAAPGFNYAALSALSQPQWLALLYLAVACSQAAYFCYNYALTRLPASRASTWLYLEPPVAALLGFVLLGEVITLNTLAGAALIAIALYFAGRL